MNTLIYSDIRYRPSIFCQAKSITTKELDDWLQANSCEITPGLRDFWLVMGGGEFFESETILSPHGDKSLGDNILARNQLLQKQGLSPNYFVFHVGLGYSAIRLADKKLNCLDSSRPLRWSLPHFMLARL